MMGKRLTIEYVRHKTSRIAKGYKCLSDTYVNSRSHLEFECNMGHTFLMMWTNFNKGHRCKKCYDISRFGRTSANWRGGVSKLNIALYDTYAHQISWCEEVRKDPINNKHLQVRCTKSDCRKWFNPSRTAVDNRIAVVNRRIGGGNRFYCSDYCKKSCSLYNQYKYPKIEYREGKGNHLRWRNLVLKRDDYECQRCGGTKNLEAHHIEGINVNPIESSDVDIGITLCDICHKEAHKDVGCRPIDLTRNKLCKGEDSEIRS